MNIKLGIFSKEISDAINTAIQYIDVDTETINSKAINILEEIASVIQNEDISDDFYVVEEIVCIFEKYNIDAGGRHDF